MHLYEVLAQKVDDWRKKNYSHAAHPVIGEILEWAAGFKQRRRRLGRTNQFHQCKPRCTV
jgi:hypothetical protein